MSLWDYRKIALNQLSAKTNDVDVLNDAGDEGWELVAILPNNIAYLKREIAEAISEIEERSGRGGGEEATRPNGGRKAILGIGNPTDTTGSNSQRTATFRDMAMPRTIPAVAAIAKPLRAR